MTAFVPHVRVVVMVAIITVGAITAMLTVLASRRPRQSDWAQVAPHIPTRDELDAAVYAGDITALDDRL